MSAYVRDVSRIRLNEMDERGWKFHSATIAYRCGYCGSKTDTTLGMWHLGSSDIRDIRVCTNCKMATNLLTLSGDIIKQDPRPREGTSFDSTGKNDGVLGIVGLYDEARTALAQCAPSCAVLMFRKLLMHVAVERGATENQKFVVYCKYLKENNVVGEPQHAMLDRIMDAGNAENHQIRSASSEEASDLLELVTMLIQSIYFMG